MNSFLWRENMKNILATINKSLFLKLLILVMVMSPYGFYLSFRTYVGYSISSYQQEILDLKFQNNLLTGKNNQLQRGFVGQTRSSFAKIQALKDSLDTEKVPYKVVFSDTSILLRLPEGARMQGVQYELKVCEGEVDYKTTVY